MVKLITYPEDNRTDQDKEGRLIPRFKQTGDILKITGNKEQLRNIGIIAHTHTCGS
ncbi:MAG: hypothetical protein QXP20_00935 [Candidatus Bathyarchaeia archaeon]